MSGRKSDYILTTPSNIRGLLSGKTPKGENTRQEVLEAARRAITRYGRDEFTTQHVAELAGVSIGTVYRYANSRVDLLDAVWPDRPQDVPW